MYVDIIMYSVCSGCFRRYMTFEDHDNIYIVSEYCAGGELFDAIEIAGFSLHDVNTEPVCCTTGVEP